MTSIRRQSRVSPTFNEVLVCLNLVLDFVKTIHDFVYYSRVLMLRLCFDNLIRLICLFINSSQWRQLIGNSNKFVRCIWLQSWYRLKGRDILILQQILQVSVHKRLVLHVLILFHCDTCHLIIDDFLDFRVLIVLVVAQIPLNFLLKHLILLIVCIFHFVEVLSDVLVLLSHFFI